MNKRRSILLSSILSLFIACTVIIQMKPSTVDYARWMEERYNVECWDYDDMCSVFDIEVEENGEFKKMTIQSRRSYYSGGIFMLRMGYTYMNIEEAQHRLDLEVKGFLGKIYVVEEINNLP